MTEPSSFASRVQRLRTRAGAGSLDRWLLIVGGVLVPLGVCLVLLGWLGASRTPLVFEQTPYLISGGLLGTCLVFGGGFIYFSYWQTVRVRDARAQHAEVASALHRIEELLASRPASASPASPSSPASSSPGDAAPVAFGRLVATTRGTMLHRADCPVVAGRDNLRTVRADDPGLKPCEICHPLTLVG